MACKVKVNRHGYLAFRLYWDGHESWEGTDWKDTPKNRTKAEGKAVEITEEIKSGTFNYLKRFPKATKPTCFGPCFQQSVNQRLSEIILPSGSSANVRLSCVLVCITITQGSSSGTYSLSSLIRLSLTLT